MKTLKSILWTLLALGIIGLLLIGGGLAMLFS